MKKMHIKGAVNIPFEEMEQQLQNNYRNRNVNMNTNMNTNINTNMNTNIKNSAGGIVLNNIFYDRNTVFIVYCDRGSKSMMICPKLAARGFQVKTVVGGIHQYHGKYLVYHTDFYKDF
jgi:rhodanese-related sulfurtransferase